MGIHLILIVHNIGGTPLFRIRETISEFLEMGVPFVHIDDPVMGIEQRFRSDVACTIFLNDPNDYAGGELVIRTSFGEQSVKLTAGDAVLYPASSLHKVTAVTKGERKVAVTWIQSLVRDPAQRELLFELGLARDTLMQEKPEAAETAQVDHAYTNLVRMWSEV